MNVRTRMAPSPTGEFHIGSMRTLLYNYAFAKNNNGKFILRIEDTDRTRFVEGAMGRTLQVINDYGLDWDEGPKKDGTQVGDFAPYIQSQRLEIYKKYAKELVDKGIAYYCFCTPERLKALKDEQQAQHLSKTKYDRHCLNLSKEEIEKKLSSGEKYVIRLRVPDDETITFKDEILGNISFPSNDIDDQVLLKSDGFPTYHLAVVIDDHLMGITHIMRGCEWIPSTPKHVLLYKAFGWELPKYGHLPNLKEVGSTKKLGKRTGSVSAVSFLQEGYLPEALINFLMFLGWNPGGEKEIFSLDEFVKVFSTEKIQTSDLVSFDRQKLLWFNGSYIRDIPVGDLYKRIIEWANKFEIELISKDTAGKHNEEYDVAVLNLVKERMKLLSEYNDLVSYFYSDDLVKKDDLYVKYAGDLVSAKKIVEDFHKKLSSVEEEKWNTQYLKGVCYQVLDEQSYKPKEAFMTLRVALTGREASPHIFDVLEVLGKDKSLRRLTALS